MNAGRFTAWACACGEIFKDQEVAERHCRCTKCGAPLDKEETRHSYEELCKKCRRKSNVRYHAARLKRLEKDLEDARKHLAELEKKEGGQ